MKKCPRCKQLRNEKEFSKHSRTKDGLRCYCKKCISLTGKIYYKKNYSKLTLYQREYYKNNKKKVNERQMIWNKNNPEKIIEIKRRFRKNHKEQIKKENKEWCKENFQKMKAINAINYLKPEKKPCVVCGNYLAEKHHPDYNKPYEIIWLCRSHHHLLHNNKLKINTKVCIEKLTKKV